jgi:hypothetical protein
MFMPKLRPDSDHCLRGHVLSVAGIDPDGCCSACRRKAVRERKKRRKSIMRKPLQGRSAANLVEG